jgi:large subunit ribosomal protein L22
MEPAVGAKAVKAIGRDFNVSFKHAVEICTSLRGMKLSEGIILLEGVAAMEKSIPFHRFNKGIGHKRGLGKNFLSRFPEKAAGEILGVLQNLQANAEYRGLDVESLRITHIQALRGISRKRRKPKGRWTTWKTEFVNVQAFAEEAK